MYMGKDLTEVRSLQRPLVPDGVGPGQHEPTFLQAIAIKARADKRHRFQDLYRHLDADFLLACWHDLNQDAASGVDGVTAAEYAGDLHANIQDLVGRLKTKRYRAKRVRRVYIPKENGKERPIGIPALEDKLVQLACAKLLAAIYEQDFLDGSYGYRPGRGALDAVRELTFDLQYGVYGYVVEADVQGFFDNLDHVWLLSMLRLRIDDRAFLGLIRKWLKAGVLDTDGAVIHSDTGTPQGGIVSPVLANVYLHYVLTCGSRRSSRPTVAAKCCCTVTPMIGSAPFAFVTMPSDFIGRCRGGWRNSACRWRRRRRILRFSRFHPSMTRRFTFLGFEFYWFEDREGTGKTTHRAQEIAGGVPADQGMDQGEPASAGTRLLPGSQPQAAGALQLLWRTRQLPRALPLLRMGHELCVPVAQSARWQAPEFQLGDFYPGPRAHAGSAPPHH